MEDQPEVVDETAEVIDLTDQRLEVDEDQNECEMSRQQKDREQFLQQQRDLMMRHNLQANEGKKIFFLLINFKIRWRRSEN